MDESTLARWWAKVGEPTETGCWPWTASVSNLGYGWFRNGKVGNAYRIGYEHFVGPVPSGYSLDHLCRNPGCVNPEHLEMVTQGENVKRGVGPTATNARKSHCKRGHELSGDNLYVNHRGNRECRACKRMLDRRHKAKRATA